jgi:hypothetical protein
MITALKNMLENLSRDIKGKEILDEEISNFLQETQR